MSPSLVLIEGLSMRMVCVWWVVLLIRLCEALSLTLLLAASSTLMLLLGLSLSRRRVVRFRMMFVPTLNMFGLCRCLLLLDYGRCLTAFSGYMALRRLSRRIPGRAGFYRSMGSFLRASVWLGVWAYLLVILVVMLTIWW